MQTSPSTIVCEELGSARRSLRIAAVTETYPPEINGVAVSAARFIEGLRRREHQIQLVRPRQDRAEETPAQASTGARRHRADHGSGVK